MQVRRYSPGDAEPIARLNDRLQAAGITNAVYPEGAEQQREGMVRERLFVAVDDGEVRGAVWLREQWFRVRGSDVQCGWLKYPVAESLIDPRFSGVPAALVRQCLREQPRLFALGLGGHDMALPRMLKALRWTGVTVPMLVQVFRPARCLRHLTALRRTRVRRVVADVLAGSGVGWLGLQALRLRTRIRDPRSSASGVVVECVERLGPWAHDLWLRTRDAYDFIAQRDPATVDAMLPHSPDVQRLRVRSGNEDLGWACVLRHDFSHGDEDRNFGPLTVGLIADALAMPGHADVVMRAARDFLASTQVDVVFSNHLHPSWIAALRRIGFIEGPSNFAFYRSPATSSLLLDESSAYVNRGDCDGPMWYASR